MLSAKTWPSTTKIRASKTTLKYKAIPWSQTNSFVSTDLKYLRRLTVGGHAQLRRLPSTPTTLILTTILWSIMTRESRSSRFSTTAELKKSCSKSRVRTLKFSQRFSNVKGQPYPLLKSYLTSHFTALSPLILMLIPFASLLG